MPGSRAVHGAEDVTFMLRDTPDESEDRALSSHIINAKDQATRYTHDGDGEAAGIEPDLDPELIRAYIAYARQYVHPRFTDDEPKEALQEFYVDLRSQAYDEEAAIPVTARKLEAGIRLAEASARIRLSESISMQDVERAKLLILSSLEDVGIDPETGSFDADIVETGQSRSQRDRIKTMKRIVAEVAAECEDGAPIEAVLDRAVEAGFERTQADHQLQRLRNQGDVYEPQTDRLRTIQ